MRKQVIEFNGDRIEFKGSRSWELKKLLKDLGATLVCNRGIKTWTVWIPELSMEQGNASSRMPTIEEALRRLCRKIEGRELNFLDGRKVIMPEYVGEPTYFEIACNLPNIH